MLLRKIGTELTGSALQGHPGGCCGAYIAAKARKERKACDTGTKITSSCTVGQTDDVHCIAQHCCWRYPMPPKTCSFLRLQSKTVANCGLSRTGWSRFAQNHRKTTIDITTDIGRLLKAANSNNSVRSSVASERPVNLKGKVLNLFQTGGRVEDD
jgi:hypothetical protein